MFTLRQAQGERLVGPLIPTFSRKGRRNKRNGALRYRSAHPTIYFSASTFSYSALSLALKQQQIISSNFFSYSLMIMMAIFAA